MRRISLGRGNQTEDHTALVLCLHTESDPQIQCVGILAVPGTGVVVPSLFGYSPGCRLPELR